MGPMTSPSLAIGASGVLEARDLQLLLDALAGKGSRLVGPPLRRGELIYGELEAVADLPVGWSDEQEGGAFRLKPRPDQALFAYGVGRPSWKQFLFPPRQQLFQAHRQGNDWQIIPAVEAAPRFA